MYSVFNFSDLQDNIRAIFNNSSPSSKSYFVQNMALIYNFVHYKYMTIAYIGSTTLEYTYVNTSLSAAIFIAQQNATESFHIFGGFLYLLKINYKRHS